VLDLNLTGSQVIEPLNKIFQATPGVPILILGQADTEALAPLPHGAQDYLLREQADGYRLRLTVRTMMDRRSAGIHSAIPLRDQYLRWPSDW